MRALNVTAQILLIVGGLNWGLVGLFQFDLVAALFGGVEAPLARIVYILVGIAAIYGIYLLRPVSNAARHEHAPSHGHPRG